MWLVKSKKKKEKKKRRGQKVAFYVEIYLGSTDSMAYAVTQRWT
jgi:hypothetical protein